MKCKICNTPAAAVFKSKLLLKYDVKYFQCSKCDYLFTEEPYWIEEAYKTSINSSDTGIIERNIYYSKIISGLLFFIFGKNFKYLDYAGGTGIFVRLMRDIGFDFYWMDLYSQNPYATRL